MKAITSISSKLIFIAILAAILTGCASPTPPPPVVMTQDPAVLVDMVVSTVNAQMTEQALLNPTSTPQPTATDLPTQTPLPSVEAATATPEATATATRAAVLAKLAYVSTYPENKREYIPNERFSVAVGFENAGTTTWEPGYEVRLVDYEGEPTVQLTVVTDKAVAPGEKVEFDFWAFGSETLGVHTWYFQLYNRAGAAITGGSASYTYTAK